MIEYQTAFLADITTNPDDDAPRLIYADWLDENGEPERAELIRLQCREASGGPLSFDDDNRAFDLEERNRQAWTAHLPQSPHAQWRFHRGFPEVLQIEVGLLLDQWDVWSSLPEVRSLELMDTTAYSLRSFAAQLWSPAWITLRLTQEPKPWLHEQPYEPSSGVAAVVMSPQAARLRELHFDFHPLGAGGIQALCDSPYLDRLGALGVDKGYMEDRRLLARFGHRLRRHSMWP